MHPYKTHILKYIIRMLIFPFAEDTEFVLIIFYKCLKRSVHPYK